MLVPQNTLSPYIPEGSGLDGHDVRIFFPPLFFNLFVFPRPSTLAEGQDLNLKDVILEELLNARAAFC